MQLGLGGDREYRQALPRRTQNALHGTARANQTMHRFANARRMPKRHVQWRRAAFTG